MKTILTGACLALCVLCSTIAQAQTLPFSEPDYNKPALFADVAEKMSVSVAEMESLLNQAVGSTISTQLTTSFYIAGSVVSVASPGDHTVRSVVIRLTNRPGAGLTITRITKEDGTHQYIGRIISLKNRDAFQLVNEGGNYYLQKKHLYDLINE
jgi:hypothetical protein